MIMNVCWEGFEQWYTYIHTYWKMS